MELDLPAALAQEEENQEKCFKSKDALEGFAAFSAKRPAHFEGE